MNNTANPLSALLGLGRQLRAFAAALPRGEDILYVDCNKNNTIDGVTLETIVGMVLQRLHKDAGMHEPNSKQYYDSYCSVLETQCGPGQLYEKRAYLRNPSSLSGVGNVAGLMVGLPYDLTSDYDARRIESELTALLPVVTMEFHNIIRKAAAQVTEKMQLECPFFQINKKEIALSQFSVLKIFRSGENIEFVPCHLRVDGTVDQGHVLLIFNWSDVQMSASYKQKKFTLNKTKIKEILRKCREEANDF